MSKKRILFIGEASFLETGFSNYYRQLLHRLHETDKYLIFEMGSYAAENDPRVANLPWKFYGVMPTNEKEAKIFGNPQGSPEDQQRYRLNQFGEWKLSAALLDCQADIIVDLRDFWMSEFILRNPYRSNYHFVWMPTVDGLPQAEHWIDGYKEVDTVLSYSHFGKKILESESHGDIKVKEVISAGVDLKTFHPIEDRNSLMKKWGFSPKCIKANTNIIGTVMRNQQRKLFPRLIQSYKKFKNANPIMAKHTCLWLHTSYPDVGFDIPLYVEREGLQADTLFTFVCRSCNHAFVSWFQNYNKRNKKNNPQYDPVNVCPKCNEKNSYMPNTQHGVSREQLNEIYNMFSIYVQASNSEGQGMPISEAKSAMCPVLCTDYSAMSEQARNGGALPIKLDTIDTEAQTGVFRAFFSREDLAEKIAMLLDENNTEMYNKMKIEARECVEKEYNWDLQAKKWEKVLDDAELKDRDITWNKPPEFLLPPSKPINGQVSAVDFVHWCYANILNKNEPHNSQGFQTWLKALQDGKQPNEIYHYFMQAAHQHNAAESKRTGVKSPTAVEKKKDELGGMII